MSCTRDRWLDVFVTKADSDNLGQYEFDDQFLCTACNVDLNVDRSREGGVDLVYYGKYASLVGYATPYIMPTWSAMYAKSNYQDHPMRSVEAGDVVRIGNPSSGHTDYLTVVEVIHVTRLYNHLGEDFGAGQDTTASNYPYGAPYTVLSPNILVMDSTTSNVPGDENSLVPENYMGKLLKTTNSYTASGVASDSSIHPSTQSQADDEGTGPKELKVQGVNGQTTTAAGQYFEMGTSGIAHIVLRVNAQVSLTAPPANFFKSLDSSSQDKLGNKQYQTLQAAMQNRNLWDTYIRASKHTSNTIQVLTGTKSGDNLTNATEIESAVPDEIKPYPLYLNKKWSHGTTLYANLDHGVKSLACIKLTGYSIVNKRQVGVIHQHEMINDDYFILHINEIEGKIVSNNKYANGAFAVLHTPVGDQSEGAIEHSLFDPHGIVVHHFDNCDSTIRNLTIKVTDRRGQPAHIGRLHLWFKLLVLHG